MSAIKEDIAEIKSVVTVLLKALKMSRLYPRNNPVYIKTMKDMADKFNEFFQYHEILTLNFGKHDIFYDADTVYHNTERQDNLALLFFTDGIRELSFKKGLTPGETEDFIDIISTDFEKEGVEDDIVTLLWETDFENIKYVVDDAFLGDGEDFEKKAVSGLQDKESDAAAEQPQQEHQKIKDISILPISDEDLQTLIGELEKFGRDKTDRFYNILLELLLGSEREEELQAMVSGLMKGIEFSAATNNLSAVTYLLKRLKQMSADENINEEIRRSAGRIIHFTGGHSVINLIGGHLDSAQKMEEDVFRKFSGFLEPNTIMPFIKLLGELKTIHARKLVVEALVHLGGKDVSVLIEKLNDPRWYVVRNIVHILRKIGDKKALQPLLKTITHEDARVKKEVIRALGELGGDNVLNTVKNCLHDKDRQVRKAAVTALSSIGTKASRKIVMDSIKHNDFGDKSLEEKKDYFEALARWNDGEVHDFLIGIMKKKAFWGKAKHDENKACAALCLGLIGSKDAVTVLNEYSKDTNKLLREFSQSAIQRIEHGS